MIERAIDALGGMGRDAVAAVPDLVRFLKSDDQSRSAAAGLALARILPRGSEVLGDAVPVLVKALKRKEQSIRGDATRALTLIGAPALPLLIEVIERQMDDPELVRDAEAALEGMGADAAPAVPALIKALQSQDENVVMGAARTLGIIGSAAKAAVPELRKMLGHTNPTVRAHAASSLGDFGSVASAAVDDLLKATQDSDSQVRREAVEALGRMGSAASSAVPALIAALDDPAAEVTVNAALALRRIGPASVPLLVPVINQNAKQRQLAVLILREFGGQAKPAVATLTKALESDDTAFVRDVIMTLARIGPAVRTAAPALMNMLKDDSNKLRGPAAYALAKMGAKESVPLLIKVLEQNDEDHRLQILAASALTMLEPNDDSHFNAALPLLIEGLGDHWGATRHASATALRLIGPRAAPAVPHLAAVLHDPQEPLRVDYLWTLAAIGSAAAPALPEIEGLMNQDEFPVRYAACYAAGSIGPSASGVIPVLLKNLESRDEFLQFMSAWAFVQISPPANEVTARCLQPLMKGLKLSDPRARSEAALALARLGPAAREAIPDLRQIARDDDATVRQSVAQALVRIGE